MKYRVDWSPSAHDRLERNWMAAERTDEITKAADQIDLLLAINPRRREAMVFGEEKTLIVEPLVVEYEIFDDQSRVFILGVWMIGYLDRP